MLNEQGNKPARKRGKTKYAKDVLTERNNTGDGSNGRQVRWVGEQQNSQQRILTVVAHHVRQRQQRQILPSRAIRIETLDDQADRNCQQAAKEDGVNKIARQDTEVGCSTLRTKERESIVGLRRSVEELDVQDVCSCCVGADCRDSKRNIRKEEDRRVDAVCKQQSNEHPSTGELSQVVVQVLKHCYSFGAHREDAQRRSSGAAWTKRSVVQGVALKRVV